MLLKNFNRNRKNLDRLVEKGEGNLEEISESFAQKTIQKKIKKKDFDYLSKLKDYFPELQPDKHFIQHVYRNTDYQTARKLFELYGIKPNNNLTNTVISGTKEYGAELISAKKCHCPFFKNKYFITLFIPETDQTIKRELSKEEFNKHGFDNFNHFFKKDYKITLPVFTDYNIQGKVIEKDYISNSPKSNIIHIKKS